MRLPWFFRAWPGGGRQVRRKNQRGRRQSTPPLRVRQLERRRVLDAAAQSLVVGPMLDAGQESTVTTSVTTAEPLVFDWTASTTGSDSAAAVNAFGASAQGGGQGDGPQAFGIPNTDPVVIAALDQQINEGQLLDLSGTDGAPPLGLLLDPDTGDTHTATVNWGDGTGDQMATVIGSGPAKALGGTHTYADGNAPFTDYTVTVTVSDGVGSPASDTFVVRVYNVDPTLTLSGNPNVDEGSPYTLNLSSSDPGDDTITSWEINWGDGNIETVPGNPSSAIHIYEDGDANYTITATATDEDGTYAAGNSVMVMVDNVAPTITAVNLSDVMLDEGQSLTVSGTFTDPALGVPTETFTVMIDWGNGSTSMATVDSTLGTYTATYLYADDHPVTGTVQDTFSITVTVTDDDGGSSSSASDSTLDRSVTIKNVAPTITAVNLSDAMLNEGQSLTVSGTFTDPALGVVTESFTVMIDWGNGDTTIAVVDAALGTYTATYLYQDDHPSTGTLQDTFAIVVMIADDDGGNFSSASDPGLDRSVIIKNVAPTVALGSVSAINENGTATLTGSYTDIGLLDQHVVTVNWGDPNDSQLSTFNIPAIQDAAGAPTLTVGQMFVSSTDEALLTITAINATTGQVSFSVQHQYLDDGLAPGNGTTSDTSTITVTVADDDTGTNFATTSVLISNVAPTVALGSVSAINENGSATLTGSYTDIGLLDQHVVTIGWGDPNDPQLSTFNITAIRDAAGTATLIVGQTFVSSTDEAVLTITAVNAISGQVSFSVQHQFLDDGVAPGNNTASDTNTISVTVADDDTGSNAATASVLVQNVAPTVALGSVSAINENGTATLSGSYTDIGLLDQHVVTVNWGDPNDTQLSTFSITAIRDAAGTATLGVGQMFVSSTDEAVLTITAVNAATGQVSFSVQHQYVDDGLAPGNNTASDTSTIVVTVADDDTGSNMANTSVLVQNVAPTIALGSVSAINENGTATLTGSYTDIGLLDQHVVTVNWGDPNDAQFSTFAVTAIRNAAGATTLTVGQTFASSTDEAVLTITAINAATGQVTFSVQHQYLDDGLATAGNGTASDTSTIQVTVADDDTGSNVATTSVLVQNVAPTVALGSVSAINENGTATLAGSFTDIGLLDAHVVTVNWDDPNDAQLSTFSITSIRDAAGVATLTVGQTFNSSTDEAVLTITAINATTGQVSFSVQHQYLDDGLAPGNNTASDTSTIIVTVADDDAGSNAASTSVLVQNVAPTVALGSISAILENGTATLTGSYTDIGLLDQHVVTVNWGDPNDTQLSTFAVTAIRNAAGAATLTIGQTFASSTDEAVLTITAINVITGQVSFSVQHQYLDDGIADGINPQNGTASDTSTIVVTIADDDTGSNAANTSVLVQNVGPQFINTVGTTILENSTATISAVILDPGTLDVFSVIVNWQDGVSDTIAALGITDVASTTIGGTTYTWNATTRQLTLSHHYNDDNPTGTLSDEFPVSLVVSDDDLGVGSTTIVVVVQNDAPNSLSFTISDSEINEGDSLSIFGSFTDRLIGFPTEDFRAFVIWGDGNSEELTLNVTNLEAMFASISHTYIDNDADNIFTIRLRVADDDMGAFASPDNFLTGVEGVDFVELAMDVTVLNVNPTLLPLAATDVESTGRATVTLSFSDPGADSFEVLVDWGDQLSLPPEQRFVVEVAHVGSTPTTYTLEHFYTGPPDPQNPTADIIISVVIHDDDAAISGVVENGISNLESIAITNPGIDSVNVAIDTTPQVPRLEFSPTPPLQTLLDQSSATIQSLQSNDVGAAGGETAVSSERFLELVAYSPDGTEIGRYRLSEEALSDLRGLFATLPDGHYKIFLVRTDNNSQRLVMEVYVRRGRVIDPSDDSEGTRDRPPTSESEQQKEAAALEENPLFEPAAEADGDDSAMLPSAVPAGVSQSARSGLPLNAVAIPSPQPPAPNYNSLRWGASLAGLAMVAGSSRWSRKVDAALERADRRAWQRLRRAGRLGGANSPSPSGRGFLRQD